MISKIKFSGQSFVGRRKINQDAILMEKIDKDTFLFAVADGMGGHKGGEIASNLVITTLFESVKKHAKSLNDLKLVLEKSIKKCNKKIASEVKEKPELTGMGTTLVCVLFYKDKYAWANIGDSRVYLLENGSLVQLSQDHSFINEFEKKNGEQASPEMIKKYGHFLTKCLDGKKCEPDLFPEKKKYEKIKEDTGFILCSDGLINDRVNTNLAMLKNYFTGMNDLEKSVENLISQAFHSGSKDNISLVLIDVGIKRNGSLNLKHFEYPPVESKEMIKNNIFYRITNWFR